MKKVLILCDDYYPSSRATIAITQRFAEGLVRKGYDVSVLTIREYVPNKPTYPEEHNGVKVYDYSDFEKGISEDIQKKIVQLDKRNAKALRFVQREKRLKFRGRVNPDSFWGKWNTKADKIRKRHRKIFFEDKVYSRDVYFKTAVTKYMLSSNRFDEIISVSLPFTTHMIAHQIKKEYSKVKWVAIAFDPYAFDEVFSQKILKERYKEELRYYSNVDKIMFLSQFEEDYVNSPLKDKISYFELPNIRPLTYNDSFSHITYDKGKISCVFLGNLFFKQRHPKFLFDVIEKLNDDIVVYLIGSLIDLPKEYIDMQIENLNGKLVYCGRVGQEEAINSMLKADVLLNIGHHTSNQCPSKVIEYVCTGKPIWNISKIPNCTSLPYLIKYPRQFTLYEYEELDNSKIKALEDFIYSEKYLPDIPFEEIELLYPECTMAKMIEAFEE